MRERTNDVEVERDVKVTMPDGTGLLTDIYHPVGVAEAPTLLERTPYGRHGPAAAAIDDFASRGYRFVLQACRGTDGSGGAHSYFAERPDGRATADWVAQQPWFDGSLGTYGGSYMGFTQWALASTEPPYLKAMAVGLSASVRSFSWYPGGSLALEVIVPWDVGAVAFNQARGAETDTSPEGIRRMMAVMRSGLDHLPLGEAILYNYRRGSRAVSATASARRRGRSVLGTAELLSAATTLDGADAAGRWLARLSPVTGGEGLRGPAPSRSARALADRCRWAHRRWRRGRYGRGPAGLV